MFTTATKLLLPGLGGVLSAPYAYAVTWAIGLTAIRYFEDVDGNQERLRRVFENALAEGKRMFSRQAVEEFRREKGTEVESFVKSDVAPEEKSQPARSPEAAPAKPRGVAAPSSPKRPSAPKRRRAPTKRSP